MQGRVEDRRRPRRWLSYLLVTLISLGSGEIALRIYNHLQPSFVFYTSSYNRYRGRPHEPWFDSQMNSSGFMDGEFGPKRSGTYRIVAIGDSFAHGVVPYRDNVLTIAESELQKTRPGLEIYNLGIPRIGPREYVALLVNEGLTYQPDTVLVTFFAGNDFRDAAHDYQQRPLYEYSYVASLLRFAFYVAPRVSGVDYPFAKDVYDDSAKSLGDEGYQSAKRQAAEFFQASPAVQRQDVEISLGYLREIQRVCESRRIKLVVAVFPDEMQLYEPVRREFLADARGEDGAPLDLALPNRLLDAGLESAHIAHLDLLPRMLEAARTTALYKPNDTHWNIAGNALAAREIAAFLESALDQSRP
jgi:hypothetical protein